jgi:GT2 family glycosyltransferase
MESSLPQVDLITINYNGLAFLGDFFKSLNNLNYPKDKLRVFFVDNNSRDGSIDFVKVLGGF